MGACARGRFKSSRKMKTIIYCNTIYARHVYTCNDTYVYLSGLGVLPLCCWASFIIMTAFPWRLLGEAHFMRPTIIRSSRGELSLVLYRRPSLSRFCINQLKSSLQSHGFVYRFTRVCCLAWSFSSPHEQSVKLILDSLLPCKYSSSSLGNNNMDGSIWVMRLSDRRKFLKLANVMLDMDLSVSIRLCSPETTSIELEIERSQWRLVNPACVMLIKRKFVQWLKREGTNRNEHISPHFKENFPRVSQILAKDGAYSRKVEFTDKLSIGTPSNASVWIPRNWFLPIATVCKMKRYFKRSTLSDMWMRWMYQTG